MCVCVCLYLLAEPIEIPTTTSAATSTSPAAVASTAVNTTNLPATTSDLSTLPHDTQGEITVHRVDNYSFSTYMYACMQTVKTDGLF